MTRLTLIARKSPLAKAQANIVARKLESRGVNCALKYIATRGDEIADPLSDIGGKELFLDNLRRALQSGEADIAIHSLKDIPAAANSKFALVAAGFCEDPRDVFLSPQKCALSELAAGAKIGTCSPRRAALLREYCPDLKSVAMRGNVQTRIQKMQNGECEGIILAAAGLRRLNLIGGDDGFADEELHLEYLPSAKFIPAPGQGILAAECDGRKLQSEKIQNARDALRDSNAEIRRVAETEFARIIGGDCHTPLGAFAEIESDEICLRAFYAGDENFRQIMTRNTADKNGALAAANEAAKKLSRN